MCNDESGDVTGVDLHASVWEQITSLYTWVSLTWQGREMLGAFFTLFCSPSTRVSVTYYLWLLIHLTGYSPLLESIISWPPWIGSIASSSANTLLEINRKKKMFKEPWYQRLNTFQFALFRSLSIIIDVADAVCCGPLVLLNIYLCRDSQLSMDALLQQGSDIQMVLVGAAQKDQSLLRLVSAQMHCNCCLCLSCLSLEIQNWYFLETLTRPSLP